MKKKEFLDILRTQLQGTLSEAEIEGHLHYYSEYIADAVASGKTEEEVTEELGSPVFIAKTLIDAAGVGEYTQGRERTSGWNESYSGSSSEEEENYHGSFHTYHISPFVAKWVIPAVLIVVVVLVLLLLGTIVGAAVSIIARLFVPILLVVLVIAIFKSRG